MDYIKLNEKKYAFWFSMKAQREMMQVDMEDKDDVYLIYLGLKYGGVLDNKPIDINEESLLDIFEVDHNAFKASYQLLTKQMGELRTLREIP
jgi:hypothetical protein